jgi:arylsulfatase A-like enzyme
VKLSETTLAAVAVATFVLLVETLSVVFLEGPHYVELVRHGATAPLLWSTYAGIFLVPVLLVWAIEAIWPGRRSRRRGSTAVLVLCAMLLPLSHAPTVLGPGIRRALTDPRLLSAAVVVVLVAAVWLVRASRAGRRRAFEAVTALLVVAVAALAVANVCLILRSADQVLSVAGIRLLAVGILASLAGAVPLLAAFRGALHHAAKRRFALAALLYTVAYALVVLFTPAGKPDLRAAVSASAQSRPSILLVVVDTLRRDHVTADPRGLTPGIARLANEGIWFERAYAPSPWTTPSFASIYTSTHPSRHNAGYRDPTWGFRRPMARALPTLAEVLSQAGYWTGSVSTNPHLSRSFGLDRGFHVYRNVITAWTYHAVLAALRERGWLPGRGTYYVVARDQTARARRLIRAARDSGRPFFAVVHYMDPHSPYDAPETLGAAPVDAVSMEDRYRAEVAYADHYVGRLLDGLREEGLYDDLLVVVTSDHGEELTELRQNPPNGRRVRDHGHTLFNEAIRVPLAVKLPGDARAGTHRSDLVSLIDLAPTILEVAGLEAPEGFAGRSLLEEWTGARPRLLFSEGIAHGPEQKACVRDNDKVILHALPPHPDYASAYDLSSDPGEKHPLAVVDGDGRYLEMYDLLVGFIRSQESVADTSSVEIDPHVLRQLRALGYVD